MLCSKVLNRPAIRLSPPRSLFPLRHPWVSRPHIRCAGVSRLADIPTVSTPPHLLPSNSSDLAEPAGDGYKPPPLELWHRDSLLLSGCEPGRCLHVAVLLSGGVDSSLALQLLVAAGHHCKAFYLQIWFQEDFRNFWDTCPWEEDLSYAQQVCDSLGVDLEVVPMTSAYWDRVVSHSVSEIRAGRTPNPDVMCNTHVKFGAFFDYLDAQQGQTTTAPATKQQEQQEQQQQEQRDKEQQLGLEGWQGPQQERQQQQQGQSLGQPAVGAKANVGHGKRLHDYPCDRVASGHYARVLRSPTAAAPAEPATPAATPCTNSLFNPSHQLSQQPSLSSHPSNNSGGRDSDISSGRLHAGTCSEYEKEEQQAQDQHSAAQLEPLAGNLPGSQLPGQAKQGGQLSQQGREAGEAGQVALLCLTPDAVKDQTYFLAHLSPAQLSRALFPLGALTKAQVRQLAAVAGLATQARKDSQGICFLGKVKFPEFVQEHLGVWPGLIVEEQQQQQQQAEGSQALCRQAERHEQQQEQQRSGQPRDGSSVATSVRSETHGSSSSSTQEESCSDGESKGSTTTIQSVSSHRPTASYAKNDNSNGNDAVARAEGSGRRSTARVKASPASKEGAKVLARFGGQHVLGVHQGYWFYTLGQRGGIRLPGGPWYVVRKDCDLNIVYVSRQYQASAASRSAFVTGPFSWLSHPRPRQPIGTVESPRCAPPPLYCKVRHGPHAYRCELREVPGASGQADSAQGALVVLDGCDQGLAAGQYAVLYQEGVCLGSAVIQGPSDASVQGYAGPDATGQPVVLHACQL